MIETPVIVGHEDGIEGRPIALLVQEASQYASKVYIQVDNKKIDLHHSLLKNKLSVVHPHCLLGLHRLSNR